MTPSTFENLWQEVLSEIKNKLGEKTFNIWFNEFSPKTFIHNSLKIEVPSKFVKDWIEKNYFQTICQIIKSKFPEVKAVEIIVNSEKTTIIRQKSTVFKRLQSLALKTSKGIFDINPQTNLNPRYRFDNFVVGKTNELAFTACQAVVKNLGSLHNPLFIYGPVGVGKTHLLQATGNEICKIYKNLKVKYITTEDFTNQFINSIKNQSVEEFRFRFRDVDVLILDDVHFLSGKISTQEELFHTFNFLYNLSKQIIFSSDRPPALIPDIEERLRSRFEGGLIVDINPPDFETRVAILKMKAQEKGLELENEILEYIAEKFTNNIRELEGVLSSIYFESQLNKKITLEIVKEIIKRFSKEVYRKFTPRKIIKTIVNHYELKEEEVLLKKIRNKNLVQIRQILIYLLREYAQLSYTSIAELLKKDHTTIIYSYEKVVEKLKTDEALKQEIEILKSKLNEV
ncbi:Chromosomal replication initiator protein DnaA [bacterium HR35]|nr:Chromosomal replication initiator protein DnaA [bacterium HR35]